MDSLSVQGTEQGSALHLTKMKKCMHAAMMPIRAFSKDVIYHENPTMDGEDFSFYLDEVPGSFALVGSDIPEKDTECAHHHGKFNIDEDALSTGAELYAQ